MPEGRKKKPAWLTGEPSEEAAVGQKPARTGGRKGPLAEDDTGNLLTAESASAAGEEARARTQAVPRVGMPEAGDGCIRRPAVR